MESSFLENDAKYTNLKKPKRPCFTTLHQIRFVSVSNGEN